MEAARAERSAHIRLALALPLTSIAVVLATAIAFARPPVRVTLPMRLEDNRMMLSCVVNGEGPYTFILDTGGGGDVVLARAVVRALHLRERNVSKSHGGVGNAAVNIGETRLRSLAIGPFAFYDQPATVIDLAEVRDGIGFRRLDGIIGYSILRRLSAKLDFDRRTITLSRAAIAAPSNARSTPFSLSGEIPRVAVKIDGIAGSAFVDTGDRSSLTLLNRFGAAHRFDARFAGPDRVVTGFGIGGPIYGKVIRVPALQLFGETVPHVVTRVSRQTAGGFAYLPEAANIGMGTLERFDLIFDYRHRTIESWPSRAFGYVQPTDGAGMWIVSAPLGARVYSLERDRPASRAGLRVNDVITAVDGAPMSGVRLGDVRSLFFGGPGTKRRKLRVRRGAETRDFTVTLERTK